MSIKDLQKLDVCSDNGNQISLISSLQLCRAKLSQSSKNFMADDRQQFKGNKMVAVLFRIVKDPPEDCQDSHEQEQSLAASFQDCLSSQDSQEDGAEVSQNT